MSAALRALRALTALTVTTTLVATPVRADAVSLSTAHVTVAADAEPLFAAPTRLDRIGRILAPVMIDGQGPFRFIVDTGASRSAISPRLVAKLGLQGARGADVRLSGVTGTAVVPTVRVGLLEAGAIRLQHRELPVIELPVLADADGILGADGFAGMRLDIDFVRDRVSITRSQRRRALPGHLTVPARLRFGGLLVVDAKIGTIPVRAVVDTGAERTLGNSALQRRLRLRPRLGAAAGETQVFGATEAMQAADSALAPPISFGAAQLTKLEVAFGDLHVFRVWGMEKSPAMLVGMDMLGTVSRLVIDYRRSEVFIKP